MRKYEIEPYMQTSSGVRAVILIDHGDDHEEASSLDKNALEPARQRLGLFCDLSGMHADHVAIAKYPLSAI
jgi:hypothetical protein